MRASLISARSAEAAEHCSGAVFPRRRGIAAGPADAGHRYRGECQIDTAGYIYHWICCLRLQETSQVLEKAGNNWRRERDSRNGAEPTPAASFFAARPCIGDLPLNCRKVGPL